METINKSEELSVANMEEVIRPEVTISLYDRVYDLMGKAASTHLGQFAMRQVDRVLWTVEKTIKWSIPAQSEQQLKPVRPLPWIFFIPTIIALRLVRFWLTICAILIGNEPVAPAKMISFIQIRRRKLRSVRYRGLRAMRLKSQTNQEQNRRGFIGRLTTFASYIICKTIGSAESCATLVVRKQKKISKDTNSTVLKGERQVGLNDGSPADDDDEIPCGELLEKYANVESAEDSDFLIEHEEDSSASSLSTTTNTSEFSENEENITEIKKSDELKRKKNKKINKNKYQQQLNQLNQHGQQETSNKVFQILNEQKEQIQTKLNTLKDKIEKSVDERVECQAIILKGKLEEKICEIQARRTMRNLQCDETNKDNESFKWNNNDQQEILLDGINLLKQSAKIYGSDSREIHQNSQSKPPTNGDFELKNGIDDADDMKNTAKNSPDPVKNGNSNIKDIVFEGTGLVDTTTSSSDEDVFYSAIGSPNSDQHQNYSTEYDRDQNIEAQKYEPYQNTTPTSQDLENKKTSSAINKVNNNHQVHQKQQPGDATATAQQSIQKRSNSSNNSHFRSYNQKPKGNSIKLNKKSTN